MSVGPIKKNEDIIRSFLLLNKKQFDIICLPIDKNKKEKTTMQFYSKKFNKLSVDEIYEILKSRQKVFLVEQGITCLDADGIDKESLHCFFVQNGVICAYLRAFAVDENTVKIGRVLTLEHKKGLGRDLMQNSICAIKNEFCCNF